MAFRAKKNDRERIAGARQATCHLPRTHPARRTDVSLWTEMMRLWLGEME